MKTFTLAALACFAMPATLSAHATLEVSEAARNSTYKAVIRIGHGCDGEPTKSVTVTIPEGVISAKPMPKPGWDLDTTVGAYERSYEYHGTHTEGVQSITWSGGSLDDAHYDEFVFRARITDAFEPGETIYFPVVQLCENGTEEWVDIPDEGAEDAHLDSPAPSVTVTEGAHSHH